MTIVKEGRRRVILPAAAVWDDFFDAPDIDLPGRDQPPLQARDGF